MVTVRWPSPGAVSGPLALFDLVELPGREGEAVRGVLESLAAQSVQDFAGACLSGGPGPLEIEEGSAQGLNGAFVVTRGDGLCRL